MSIKQQHVYRAVHGFVVVCLHYQHTYLFVEAI